MATGGRDHKPRGLVHPDDVRLARVARELRRRDGRTQFEVARTTGVSIEKLRRIESEPFVHASYGSGFFRRKRADFLLGVGQQGVQRRRPFDDRGFAPPQHAGAHDGRQLGREGEDVVVGHGGILLRALTPKFC